VIVYLAGGMRGNWREKVKNEMPQLIYLDPCSHGLSDAVQYSAWDKQAVERCDMVFAYLEKDNPSGIGMCVEIGLCLGLYKPVIFVNEKKDRYWDIVDQFVETSPWPSRLLTNLDDGISALKSANNSRRGG
jgi:hypothetical protein